MNKLNFTGVIVVCLMIFSQNSYGFSCIGTNFRDKSNEGLRNYYQKESNVVIFTGNILAVKKVEADRQITSAVVGADENARAGQDQSNIVFQKVLIIKTDKFWLGQPESELAVNTEMNGGDEETGLSEGDEFIFIARRDEQNKLWLSSCEYSLFPEFDYKKLGDRLTEIFGEPKTL